MNTQCTQIFRPIPAGIAMAVLYFLFAWGTYMLRKNTGFPPIFWVPNGIALSALLICGFGLWPWLLLTSLVFNVLRGFPLPAAAIVTAGHLAGPLLAAFLFRRMVGPKPRFDSLRTLLLFVAIMLSAGAMLSSGISILGFKVGAWMQWSGVVPEWAEFWLNESLGALLLVPPLLTFAHDKNAVTRFVRSIDSQALAVLVFSLLLTALCYTPLSQFHQSVLIRPSLFFLLIIWAAIRYGLLGSNMVLLIAGIGVTIGLGTGNIPVIAGRADHVLLQEAFVLILGVTGLVISATMREKNEALEARDTFFSLASHELKTPLTSLKLQTQLTQRQLGQGKLLDHCELNKRLAHTDRQVDRLTRLVDDMLDVSRISAGRVALRPERFELSQLVTEVVTRMTPLLQQAGCTVNWQPPAPIEGVWDRFRLDQLLVNLLSNAARYCGGKPVWVELERFENEVEIRVRDEGPGIDPEDQSRIFQRFERVAHDHADSGLGLGLFIVREVAELHGGSVRVQSQLGQGSTFFARFPLAKESPSSALS